MIIFNVYYYYYCHYYHYDYLFRWLPTPHVLANDGDSIMPAFCIDHGLYVHDGSGVLLNSIHTQLPPSFSCCCY